MTKEKIEVLKKHADWLMDPPSGVVQNTIADAILTAVDELSRYEYRWHNLKMEPDDLPEEDGNYWVHGHWASGKEAEGEAEYKTADKRFRTSWYFTVDAWKKVEPFKEASE